MPMSPPALSITFRVHVPAMSSLLNPASPSFGEKTPSIVGTPAPHSSSTGLPAWSSRVAFMSLPLHPNGEPGTPGLSIKLICVVVSSCVSMTVRSPTQVCSMSTTTFRSVIEPLSTITMLSQTPFVSLSGMLMPGELHAPTTS